MEVWFQFQILLFFYNLYIIILFELLQRLNAGDDPSTAFVLSSEAALAGAKSTQHMQAQVKL